MKNTNPLKDWLEDIRNSDDATKKFWLFTLTSVSMAVVVGLWAGYVTVATPGVLSNKKVTVKNYQEPGATEIFGQGFTTVKSALGSSLSRGIALVKDTVFKKENTISISNKDRNFLLEGIDAAVKRNLPID